MFNALVVEGDQKQAALYQSFLDQQGYVVIMAASAEGAVSTFEENCVDIVLCDALLPGVDGCAAVYAIRAVDEEVPIITLSPSGDFRSKQRAFNAGADDFMVQPVDLNELLLRMSALLRRAHVASRSRVVIGNAVLDSSTFTVVDGSVSTELPPKEFKVLYKLCSAPGRIFTRSEIMDDVWGIHATSNERTVDVHVKRIRERFPDGGSFRIETVRGVGYKVVATGAEGPAKAW